MAKRDPTPPGDPVDWMIGANLRALRRAAGLTMEALAAPLDVSAQQVSKYERGVDRLTAAMLFRIGGLLGVRVGRFYAGLQAEPGPGVSEVAPGFDRAGAPARSGGGLLSRLAGAPTAVQRDVVRNALADLTSRGG